MKIIHFFWACFALFVGGVVWSCSSESRSFSARTYHNTTARYNGYFLANEKLKEAEVSMRQGHQDNYNRFLEVFVPVSEASATALLPMTEEVIKKASIPIQRHKNSDWTDNSYLLIGRARWYQNDHDNAIKTYKYVYAKGKGKAERQQALIWLMRIYIEEKKLRDAKAVDDYLQKETLNKANLKDWKLTQTWLAISQKEISQASTHLRVALSLMKRGDERTRLYFLLGQLLQAQAQDSIAYKSYKKVLSNNPAYELSFFTRLNMAQTVPLTSSKEIKKIEKTFRRMLKDAKNLEYKNKIYYEMAAFEQKQNHIAKALALYQTAAHTPGKIASQKGYAYYQMAQIYYETYENYIKAKYYYDSSLISLDTNESYHPTILRRNKILAEFVTHYLVVEREDSLQALTNLSPEALNTKLDKMLAERKEAERKAALAAKKKEKQERASSSSTTNFDNKSGLGFALPDAEAGTGTWYFYNTASISSGRSSFLRKWGRRPLGDDWRRSKKEVAFAETNEDTAAAAKVTKDSLNIGKVQNSAPKPDTLVAAPKPTAPPDANAEREALKKGLPFDSASLAASNARLRPALYAIARIYDQKLEKPRKAAPVFERLVKDFYQWEKTPEIMYALYLLYGKLPDELNAQIWRNRLLAEFPKSSYARLLNNPNFLVEQKQAEQAAQSQYAQAYMMYQNRQYADASRLLTILLKQYPETQIADKVALLKAMIDGQTLGPQAYKTALEAIPPVFPKSNLLPHIKNLLETLAQKTTNLPVAPSQDTVQIAGKSPYKSMEKGPYWFVAVGPSAKNISTELLATLSDFNRTYFNIHTLSAVDLVLNDKNTVWIVREFEARSLVISYLRKQKEENRLSLKEKTVKDNLQLFVITPENFQIFYKNKDINQYLKFYNANFKETY